MSDPDPEGISSPWRCQRLCLRAGGDASHVLVIQDDALPCEFFAEAVLAAIAAKPNACISFCVTPQAHVTSQLMTMALKKREPWAKWSTRDHWPLVAASYPRELAERVADFVDERKPKTRGDDAPMAEALRVLRAEAWATVPSLVEHLDDTPSLIGRRYMSGRNRARCAKYWIGDRDPRTIQW